MNVPILNPHPRALNLPPLIGTPWQRRYKDMIVAELRQLATTRGLPVNSKMRKQELVDLLEEDDSRKRQQDVKALERLQARQAEMGGPNKENEVGLGDSRKRPYSQQGVLEGDAKRIRGEPVHQAKPRLTTPDLEYDYDRSQLRDPRPTPGRSRRPRWDDMSIPMELRGEIELKFHIPRPEKPKGRTNAYQKDQFYKEEALMNPLAISHSKYVCHRKGRDGSPTYDEAGFQLDYDKVEHYMKPRGYSKSSMVSNMQKRVSKITSDGDQMIELFFLPDDKPSTMDRHIVSDYMKDQVSKDISVPWHQITPDHFRLWRQKGFQPVGYSQWWRNPTEEETKRMRNMMFGASMRKNL